MFYATVTGLVYEEQMENVTKHQLKQSAYLSPRAKILKSKNFIFYATVDCLVLKLIIERNYNDYK